MIKLIKIFAAVILTVSVVSFAPSSAEARCPGGYYSGCGQWGGWGWGPWGPGVGWGQGNPYFMGSDAVGCAFALGTMGIG